MTKYFCDKCKKPLDEIEVNIARMLGSEEVSNLVLRTVVGQEPYDLCKDCTEKFLNWIEE